MEASKKPIITIGMIVKDEEKNLERTLRSFVSLRERVPCELIIADTGSKDGTREIARQYADEVFDYVWHDDFAAARNAVMERAHGEWYWSVDADEPLVEKLDHIVDFFNSTKRYEYESGIYLLRNRMSAEEDDQYTDHYAHRLFRLATGARFVHAVHEIVEPQPNDRVVMFNEHTADHYGYRFETIEQIDKKRARNVALIEVELEQRPEDLKLLCEMMDMAYPEEAERYAERTLAVMRKAPLSFMNRRALYCLLNFYYNNTMHERALAVGAEFAACCKGSSAQINTEYALAFSARALNRYEDACTHARHYFELMEEYDAGVFDKEVKTYFLLTQHTPQKRAGMHVLFAMMLLRLERTNEAAEQLAQTDLMCVADDLFGISAACFAQLARLGGEDFCVATYYATVQKMQSSEKDYLRRRAVSFFNTVNSIAFMPQERENHAMLQALAKLPGDDLLLAFVRLVLAEFEPDFEQKLTAYVNRITDWGTAPSALYRLAFRYGAALPEEAFALTPARSDALTAELAGYNDYAANALLLWRREQENEVLAGVSKKLFLLALLARALMALGTVSDTAQKSELIEAFTAVAEDCLAMLYRPEVFQSDALMVLSALHRFGYWMCAARTATAEEYGNCLKQAVAAMPAQKAAVDFLTDCFEERLEKEQKQRQAEQSEFAALAKSVKKEAYRLVSQGLMAEARSVAQQLSQLCPEDEEIKELLLMLSSQPGGIH